MKSRLLSDVRLKCEHSVCVNVVLARLRSAVDGLVVDVDNGRHRDCGSAFTLHKQLHSADVLSADVV